MVAHGDGGVFVHHANGDPLACSQQTHTRGVAGVELALAGLDASRAAQEWSLIYHHFVTCYVREIQVVYLLHTHTHRKQIGIMVIDF